MTAHLKGGLDEGRLLSPTEFESGLVTFCVDDSETFVEQLVDEGIVVRSIPAPGAVRASVRAFNTRADVDALLNHVDQ